MQRTYRMPGARVGLAALVGVLVLLGGTGTCVASGAAQPVRLAVLADAAPLGQGAGYDSAAEARRVRVLQRVLRRLGWGPGPADGLFGPRTETALVRFQAAAGLTADGVAGANSWRALMQARRGRLRRGAGYATPNGSQRVRVLQRRLQRRGLRPGPNDGRFGPRTELAVARLQRAARLTASGAVDRHTRLALARGPQRRDHARPAAADVEPITPQTARAVAIDPLADLSLDTSQDGGLRLPMFIAAVALLIAAMGSTLILRRRAAALQSGASGYDEAHPLLATGEGSPQPAQDTVISSAPARKPVRAIGYASVPTADAARTDSLEAQATAIDRVCEGLGWELMQVVRDVENGHVKGFERPGLLYALERIAEGEASCLVVSELERLSRTAADLGRIVEWIEERDGRLVAIDLRLDTGSPQGRLAARALMAVGEWEGRRIADQTAKGLTAARDRGATTGRPAVADRPALKERIVAMRAEGLTLQAIADRLNAEGVPTMRGGSEWRPSSVQAAAGYRRPKGSKRPNLDLKRGGSSMP